MSGRISIEAPAPIATPSPSMMTMHSAGVPTRSAQPLDFQSLTFTAEEGVRECRVDRAQDGEPAASEMCCPSLSSQRETVLNGTCCAARKSGSKRSSRF